MKHMDRRLEGNIWIKKKTSFVLTQVERLGEGQERIDGVDPWTLN